MKRFRYYLLWLPFLLLSHSATVSAKAGGDSGKSNYGIHIDQQKVCPAVQPLLGQLLYINVDGYGPNMTEAIHPDYVKLVKLLNIGGVIPHFGLKEMAAIQAATQVLFEATEPPLLLGIDSETVNFKGALANQQVAVGLGGLAKLNSQGDWLNKDVANPSNCFEQQSFLAAFLDKAIGFNHALGPAVAQYARWGGQAVEQNILWQRLAQILVSYDQIGLKTTLKYFPYSLGSTVDQQTTLKIFQQFGQRSDFVMTSPVLDRQVDSQNVVTFSKTWLTKLRTEVGFDGLVVSDAISKLGRAEQNLRSASQAWLARHPEDDPEAIVAARALLAGHDMVLLQGVARDTLRIYQQLAIMACRSDPDGRLLLATIEQAFTRISQFKNNNRGALSFRPKVDPLLIEDALKYQYGLQTDSCTATDQNKFSFLQLKQRIIEVR